MPSGQLLQPNGSSLGLRTNLGASLGSGTAAGIIPTNRINPEYWRFSLGVERQLWSDWLVELSYLGQKGSHVPIVEQLNYVPQPFRTASAIRDNAAETFLSQVVANPFQGLTPDKPGSNGATIARRRLLLQYPQFDNLSIETYRGENTYHALLARLEKRFTDGLMVQSSYTWSRFRERSHLSTHGRIWKTRRRRRSAAPHHPRLRRRAAVRAGAQWGNDWNPAVAAILGGWQFSAKYEWQSGSPLVFNQNTYFDPGCGDPRDLTSIGASTRAVS